MNTQQQDSPPVVFPLYADVVFNLPLKEAFTYQIPPTMLGIVKLGMRVLVPFGRRKLTGYVVSLSERLDKNIVTKPIEEILDAVSVVASELLSLTRWIADYYHCSWGEAIKAALPAGLEDESQEQLTLTEAGIEALETQDLPNNVSVILQILREKRRLTTKQIARLLGKQFSVSLLVRLRNIGMLTSATQIKRSSIIYSFDKTARAISKTPGEIEKLLKRSPKQKGLYTILLEGEKKLSDLNRMVPACSGPLKQLKDKGLVEIFTVRSERNAPMLTPAHAAETALQFTDDQQRVFQNIEKSLNASEFRTFLLHGVTGSGKTEIYIRCIELVLRRGKTAIMMVPEISLTPQTVGRFQRRFGDKVALLHSGLSNAERYQEWKKIQDGHASIVVGARSAIFAPFKNLGIIIIDEEHDTSYKQDSNPRYHARDTAIVRARDQHAVVVLGSATPSLESRMNCETEKYRYLSLPNRVQNRLLPIVEIKDMRKEKSKKRNYSILSTDLKIAIRHRMERKEQVFLFLNRRGTANYIFCKDCGYVFHCPRCSVTLTFHGNERVLQCHYCNFHTGVPKSCAECSGEVIRFNGFGTQKLEDEVRQLFPEARVTRLDRDTTRTHDAFSTIYKNMTWGEIDILIGTQMITKGHDFPNVTLVGVVHADLSLNIPDFRSSERTFQLLTQVAGRAGRGDVPGQVIIQTLNPDHYVFNYVCDHAYEPFYKSEIQFRKKLNYPPFTRMIALEIESADEKMAEQTARKIQFLLTRKITRNSAVELLGPSRAALYRINDKYRYHIILRSGDVHLLQSILKQCEEMPEWQTLSSTKIKLTIDVDPVNLL